MIKISDVFVRFFGSVSAPKGDKSGAARVAEFVARERTNGLSGMYRSWLCGGTVSYTDILAASAQKWGVSVENAAKRADSYLKWYVNELKGKYGLELGVGRPIGKAKAEPKAERKPKAKKPAAVVEAAPAAAVEAAPAA